MKKLVAVGLVLVGLAALASQQFTRLNGTTDTVAAATTNNYGTSVVFNVGDSATLALRLGFASTGTNTGVSTIVLEKTLDSVTWSTLETFQLVANGTTAVYTNLTYSSLTDTYQVRVTSWGNPNTTVLLTNLYAVGLTKLPR